MANDHETRKAQEIHETPVRAERFMIQLPVRYRTPESPEWFETRTENVSHTGVLFQTKSILKPSTMVDVRLEVPPPRRTARTPR